MSQAHGKACVGMRLRHCRNLPIDRTPLRQAHITRMWKILSPIVSIALPVAIALLTLFLFLLDSIGTATALVMIFAATSVAVTAAMLHLGEDDMRGADTDLKG